MKKKLFILFACLLYSMTGITQSVTSSAFNTTTGTYQEITNGTTITMPDTEQGTKLNHDVFIHQTETSYTPTRVIPNPPVSLTATNISYNSITLSVQGNSAGNDVLILITDRPAYSEYNDLTVNGDFAVPSGTLNVGDELQIIDENGARYGGTVLYKGPASTAIIADNLTDNTVWHFAAYSVVGTEYSGTSVVENALTWGTVPYEVIFHNTPPWYDAPFGWEVDPEEGFYNGAFYVDGVKRFRLCCFVNGASPAAPAVNSITTQYILLSENSNRLVMNVAFWFVGNWGAPGGPYNDWHDNDYFDIELSTDGTNFALAHRINKGNAPQFAYQEEYKNLYINLPEEFLGEKVKMRFVWKVNSNCRFAMDNMRIEEAAECDYPVDVVTVANSVMGTKADIKWTAQGNEDFWDIRYREVGAEEWTYIEDVFENPYQLTGLPLASSIEVTVRAKCSETEASPWAPNSCIFNTGFALPYSQSFTDSNSLPSGWKSAVGALATPTVFTTENSQWSVSLWDSGLMNFYYVANDWALFPVFDFGDGSYSYQLKFDLTASSYSGEVINDVLYIVMSKDGGQTFNTNDVIDQIDLSDPDGEPHPQTILLQGATGYNRLAFYTGNTTDHTEIVINDLSITETCPSLASNGIATNISEFGATVSWDGEADEWLVFVRKAGETTLNYIAQTENEIVLENLYPPAPTYEVGISHSCGEGDLAKPLIVRFTTLPLMPCEPVQNVNVTPATNSATITWDHPGIGFNLEYRRTDQETWKKRTSNIAEITILNLTAEMEYEYRIQAICSEAENDVSDWTEIATFRTVAITCFPPTNIQVTPTFKSAAITWEGEADNYELNYRAGDGNWNVKNVSGQSTTLENLVANTVYSLRIRSHCSGTAISAWSPVQTFQTLQEPTCIAPTNLEAKDISGNRALLTWKGDESNLSWNLRYRKSTATSWNNVTDLNTESHTPTDLEINTLYLWSVRANCIDEAQSPWATQSEFTTTDQSISNPDNESLRVFASGKIINIINTANVLIDRVKIIDLTGRILNLYEVNATENIIIPTSMDNPGIYIIRVESKEFSKNYKIPIL